MCQVIKILVNSFVKQKKDDKSYFFQFLKPSKLLNILYANDNVGYRLWPTKKEGQKLLFLVIAKAFKPLNIPTASNDRLSMSKFLLTITF